MFPCGIYSVRLPVDLPKGDIKIAEKKIRGGNNPTTSIEDKINPLVSSEEEMETDDPQPDTQGT